MTNTYLGIILVVLNAAVMVAFFILDRKEKI